MTHLLGRALATTCGLLSSSLPFSADQFLILALTPPEQLRTSGSSLLATTSGLDEASNKRLILRFMLPPVTLSSPRPPLSPSLWVGGSGVAWLGSGCDGSTLFLSFRELVAELLPTGCGGRGTEPPSNMDVSSMDSRFREPPFLYIGFGEEETSLPGSWGFRRTFGDLSFFSSFSSGLIKLSADALPFAWTGSLLGNSVDLGFSAVEATLVAGLDFPTTESVASSPCGLDFASVAVLVVSLVGTPTGLDCGTGAVGLGAGEDAGGAVFGAWMERMVVLLCREKGLGARRGLGPRAGLGLDMPAIWEASTEHSISESLKEDRTRQEVFTGR